MSRNLTDVNYLKNNSSFKIAHLIRVETPDGSYDHLTDYHSSISYLGNDYIPGYVTKVGAIKESIGFKNNKSKITLAGEHQSELNRAVEDLASSSHEQKKIVIYKVFLDDGNNIHSMTTDGGIVVFNGYITSIDLQEDPTKGRSIVTWSISNFLHDFEKINGRLTDDDFHRAIRPDGSGGFETSPDFLKKPEYANDTGFQHASQAINMISTISVKEKKYKVKSTGFLGLGSKLVEYEETVQKEVELGVSLAAKYIPAVYGVRKVPGIPVFIDMDATDQTKLTVVYAFCEGEINSFLNIIVDGESLICIDAEKSTNNCIGSQQNSDAISRYVNQTEANSRARRNWKATEPPLDTRIPYVSTEDLTRQNYEGSTHGMVITGSTASLPYTFRMYHGKPFGQNGCQELVDKAAASGFFMQNELSRGADYWDSNSQLADTAYIVVEFKVSEEEAEIPEIEAIIDGKNIDTYTMNLGNPVLSTEKTLNPVWHTLNMLTEVYGANLGTSNFDLETFVATAARLNALDTSYGESTWTAQNLANPWGLTHWNYIGWDTDPLLNTKDHRAIMQCNTYLPTDKATSKLIERLLAQFRGSLNMVNGKYVLTVENDDAPVTTISIGDMIGGIKIKNDAQRKKWNTINASIVDPGSNWEARDIVFFDSKYLQQDSGIEKAGKVNFDFITNYYTARTWAEAELRRSRYPRSASFTTGIQFLDLTINDNVIIDYPRVFGESGAKYRVAEITDNCDGTLGFVCEAYGSEIFSTSSDSGKTLPAPTDATIPAPTNVSFVPATDGAFDLPQEDNLVGKITWDAISDSNLMKYQVADWITVGNVYDVAKDKNYIKVYGPLTAGTAYEFKVRAVDINNTKTVYTVLDYTPGSTLGVNTTLENITGLSVTNATDGEFTGANLATTWDSHPNAASYDVEIYSAGVLLRSLNTVNNNYTYTLANNKADYASKNAGAIGAYRSLEVRVRARNGADASSWSSI